MTVTAVIAEDEIPSAQRLERLLEKRGIIVVAICASVAKLTEFLANNEHPDWLFLDIELRDDAVFVALQKISVQSRIVFTTAYADRALEAFRHGGIDYLLKPIDETKLDAAISKVAQISNLLAPAPPFAEGKSLLVSAGRMLRKIKLSDVDYFFSEGNATFVKSRERQYPVGKSLEKLEHEHELFFRISRKYLVNRAAIEKVIASEIELKSGERIAVSRQRKKEFINWFST